MSYSVYAYLTDADKIKKMYGSCDSKLFNQLSSLFRNELDELNEYFRSYINTSKDAYVILSDIINGEIHFPEIAFMYGYVYEKICKHYGRMIYNTENIWELDKQSAFIPIPFSDNFPYIISVQVFELEAKKEKYNTLKQGDGIGDYDYDQEMADLNFIFDEAIEAQKDLMIIVY